MIKVTFKFFELEIEMLSHFIESAIDVKQMNEQEKNSKSNFKTIKPISLKFYDLMIDR